MSNDRNGSPRPGKHLLTFLMALFILTLGIGIGTLITYRVGATGPGDSQLRIQTDGKPVVGQTVLTLSQAFEEMAKRVVPAVVNINTEEVIRADSGRGRGGRQGGGGDDPMQELFRQFQGQAVPEHTVQSLGSGIIVDPKGYIITNRHVVGGATKIRVSLLGGEEYMAKVIAADELSDLAVIKIEAKKDLFFAKVGDSNALKIGDWVLAIGSPFGLEHTVTAGIISATGRTFDSALVDASYQAMMFNDYLQTDAAINQGNSGGPLVNMNGEVVGINSFISTPNRSSAGVGFAVPSHTFVNVYNQILEKGRVARGWLGISMNMPFSFTPEMAKYFGVKQPGGVLITGFSDETGLHATDNGPAAKAGMKAEDVIVEFNGKKILGVQDLRLAVANTPPGQTVPVKVVRFGEDKVLQVTVAERTLESSQQSQGTFSFDEKEDQPKQEIGIEIDTAPARLTQQAGVTGGAVVTKVKPGSLGDDANLEPQDIIVAANGKKISTAEDLAELLRKTLKSGDAVVLKGVRIRPDQNSKISNPQNFYTSIVKP
jgi:serine protease Do